MNDTKVRQLALDLHRTAPRSPRAKLGGLVILGRCVDKCRAFLAGTQGEYNFWPCSLCEELEDFTGIDHEDLRDLVATGADDEAVGAWVRERAGHSDAAVAAWNWRMREKRIGELDPEVQARLEAEADELPAGRAVYVWFDLFDIEEGRL